MSELEIQHDTDSGRLVAELESGRAELRYRRKGGKLLIDHTQVPEAAEGKGIASELVRTVLQYARKNELLVVPHCPFTASYIRRHPEFQDLLASKSEGS